MSERTRNQLFDAYFTANPMGEVFCDHGRVQAMLDVEAALARAQAKVGLIPSTAVAPIEAACRAELYDFAALGQAIASAGNSAIPLVKALGKRIASVAPEAERYVHLGATSQDVMDSGLVLQLGAALRLVERDLIQLGDVLAQQAERYASTPMAGRTWLQQATPVTLGMKIASWLGAVTRSRQRLRELKPRLLCLQFGGASGTLAALGDQALPVAHALAEELGLKLPDQPWHTQRDRLVEFGAVLGLIAGGLGKMGRDISLLMQTEAAEVFEPSAPGKGGSSTMPHKRNPVGSAVLISAATRVPGLLSILFSAMPQEHERSLGLWHAEWETLPEMCCVVSGALAQAQLVGQGLRHRQCLFAKGGQRAGGAAKLQHQQTRLQLTETLPVAGDCAEPTGDLHAQRDRRCMLQPGPARQRSCPVTLGLGGKNVPQPRQIMFDQLDRTAQLQHQAGVHHILAGSAQMHITFGAGIFAGDQLAEGLDQGNRRVACGGDGVAEGIYVVERSQAGLGNGRDGRLRDQPDLSLGPGQRRFEIQHALQTPLVAEHFSHAVGGEVGVEQLVARAHRHNTSLGGAYPATGMRQPITDRGANTPPLWAGAS